MERYTTVFIDYGDDSDIVTISIDLTDDTDSYPLGYKILIDNGDGTSTTESSWPIELQHTYRNSGVYTVSLYYQRDTRCTNKSNDITVIVTDDVNVQTEHVDYIDRTSATIHGKIVDDPVLDEDLTEYGFIYSHTASTEDDLVVAGTDISKNGVQGPFEATDVSDVSGYDAEQELLFSADLTDLTHRKYVYYRAYAKSNLSTDYKYGVVKRFITEERDFSLKTEGGFVAVDTESTRESINSRGEDSSCSFELWAKRTRSDQEEVILSNTLDGYKLSFNGDNKLVLDYHRDLLSGSLISDNEMLTDNEWHHIAVTWDKLHSYIC